MKTPEEIKKGLECCFLECDDTSLVDHCRACPYQPTGLCFRTLLKDALAYIELLEQIVTDSTKRITQLENQLAAPYRQATMKEVAEYMQSMGIDCCYGEDDHD